MPDELAVGSVELGQRLLSLLGQIQVFDGDGQLRGNLFQLIDLFGRVSISSVGAHVECAQYAFTDAQRQDDAGAQSLLIKGGDVAVVFSQLAQVCCVDYFTTLDTLTDE